MKRTYTISKKKKLLASKRSVMLVHYSQPTQEEYEYLIQKEFIDEEFAEGLQDEDEIPRFERDKYKRVLFQIPTSQIRTVPFGFVFEKEKIITICNRNIEFLDQIYKVEFEEKSRNAIFTEMLFLIESQYEKAIKSISKKTRQKKLNISTLGNKDIIELVELEDALNNIITSAAPNVVIYEKLAKILHLTASDKEIIDDIIADAKQNLEQARLTIKTVQNIRNAYSTIMSNNLNSVMKVLTAATIILAIPTLVASLFGMNVSLPAQELSYAFYFVLLICFLLIGIVTLIFKLKKWL